MPSTRLHIDAAAPAVAANAAASVAAKQMQTAGIAASGIGSTPASATNEFDVAITGVAVWAAGAHQMAAAMTQERAATVGALSAVGFTQLADMNAGNAAVLSTIGQQL